MTDTSTVERFRPYAIYDGGVRSGMEPCDFGGWVRYDDCATLLAERNAWIETARLHATAEAAFLSWLREAGEHMRSEGVTVADDGTDMGEVLAAKVAECAAILKAERDALKEGLTLIERLFYIEGKDAEWRASRMNGVARTVQDGGDLSHYWRIFPYHTTPLTKEDEE